MYFKINKSYLTHLQIISERFPQFELIVNHGLNKRDSLDNFNVFPLGQLNRVRRSVDMKCKYFYLFVKKRYMNNLDW